ncbi:Uncharacterized protein FWK35_00013201 [Aphis craccivora]|uniref:Uncharacterized protein n=1 Tax=Aphis craccivora TaxID=307492 RepID=A0A6G0YUW4_APHCR|nr:Uncharacterized protein FWK35_00013201 [Aphis craccivora]
MMHSQLEDNRCHKYTDAYGHQYIDQITGLLYLIKDPGHLSNVHDCRVVKLTEQNGWKSDYSRLLENKRRRPSRRQGIVHQPSTRRSAVGPNWLAAVVDRRSRMRAEIRSRRQLDEGSPGEASANLLCRTDGGEVNGGRGPADVRQLLWLRNRWP